MQKKHQEQEHQEQQIHSEGIELVHSLVDREPQIYPVTEGVQSVYSKKCYNNSFNRFLRHIKIQDLQVLLDLGPKVLEQIIIKYVIYLRDTKEKQRGRRKLKSTLSSTAIKPKPGLSRASIEAEIASIFHFFDMNDFDLSSRSKKRIKRFLPPDESTHDDRVYTQAEKERILSECDKRAKVVILLMNSGGIRIGAINKLTIGSLEPVGSKEGYYKIIVDGRSRKDRYFTICNLEFFNALRDYLEHRERLGEDITKRSSPLIREQCDPDADTRMPWPRSLKENTIRHIVIDVLKRSGVKTSEAMMSHSFRKNFKTVCEESGMKSLHVEMLMGHHVPLNKSYMRPKDSEVIQDYIDHTADALTIDPKQRLERENQELKDDLKGFEHLREEIDELKHWVIHVSDPKHTLQQFNSQVIDELCNKPKSISTSTDSKYKDKVK
jgi:site-specific recombinase XerD